MSVKQKQGNYSPNLGIGGLRGKANLLLLLWFAILFSPFLWFGLKPISQLKINPGLFIPLLVAALTLVTQKISSLGQEIASAEEFAVKSVVEMLEEGYLLLKRGVDNRRRSRLDWLTAARAIATSRQLICQIKDPAKKAIALEKEMVYRLRIRSLLWPLDGDSDPLPDTFFADSADDYLGFIAQKDKKDPISESSLVEIYRFTLWPSSRPDPLPSGQRFTQEEIQEMINFGPRSVGLLMNRVRQLANSRSKVEEG